MGLTASLRVAIRAAGAPAAENCRQLSMAGNVALLSNIYRFYNAKYGLSAPIEWWLVRVEDFAAECKWTDLELLSCQRVL
jgi:hypothetical protein